MLENKQKNPYNICTWQPVSTCRNCAIAGQLKCRFNPRDLLRFIGFFLLFFLPSIAGMIRGGFDWYILGWIALGLLFFELWEIRILCSHCPYYAERGRILHCIANYGSLKVWKYHPEPISRAEKIQLIIGFFMLGGYPFPFLIVGKQLGFALFAFCGLGIFFWILQKYTCSACVNFSCLLNRVPKKIVDEYLNRNPFMKAAWGRVEDSLL